MAYAPTTNRPFRMTDGPLGGYVAGGAGPQLWGYLSADAAATVAGTNYFSDGQDLGMRLNDLVFVVDTGTPLVTTHRVKTLDTASRGVTLSSGTTVGAT